MTSKLNQPNDDEPLDYEDDFIDEYDDSDDDLDYEPEEFEEEEITPSEQTIVQDEYDDFTEELEIELDEPDDYDDIEDEYDDFNDELQMEHKDSSKMDQGQEELLKNIQELERKIALLEQQKKEQELDSKEGDQSGISIEIKINDSIINPSNDAVLAEDGDFTSQTMLPMQQPSGALVEVKKMEVMTLPVEGALLERAKCMENVQNSNYNELEQNPLFRSKKLLSKTKTIVFSSIFVCIICALIISIFAIAKAYM